MRGTFGVHNAAGNGKRTADADHLCRLGTGGSDPSRFRSPLDFMSAEGDCGPFHFRVSLCAGLDPAPAPSLPPKGREIF